MGRVRGDTAERPPLPGTQEVLVPWPGRWPWRWTRGSGRGQNGLPWGRRRRTGAPRAPARARRWTGPTAALLSPPFLTLGLKVQFVPVIRAYGALLKSVFCPFQLNIFLDGITRSQLITRQDRLLLSPPDGNLTPAPVVGWPLSCSEGALREKLAFPSPFPAPRCTCSLWGGLLSQD